MRRTGAVLVACLLATSVQAERQVRAAAQDARPAIDAVFTAFTASSPGCAVGVYKDGAILYTRGYGMASLEHDAPITPGTVFYVGSISKQFTAMSILMLQKEGKLSLDDPIRKYIPEMPAYADKITLRRALSQTSGLRDLYVMMAQTGRTFEGDTIDALRVITRSAEPNYEPGARYLYTNSGWILAAQIVYRLTGKTLAQFADERIFAPLGMHDTRYQADAASIIPSGAEGYAPRSSGGGFRVARSSYDGAIMGAGAVHTSVAPREFAQASSREQLRRGNRGRPRRHRDDDDGDDAERRLSGALGTEPGVRDRAQRRDAARVARRLARR